MNRILLPLALSVGVIALSAAPGAAQMRRSTTSPAATSAAAPADPGRAGSTLRVFIGPAMDLGNQSQTIQRTRSTTTTSATTGTNAVTTSGATTSVDTTNLGLGLGVMYGGDYTWWGGNRAGLGVSLFGSYVGAGNATNILHLNGQSPDSYKNSTTTAGTTTTTTTLTDSTAITSGMPGGPSYTVTVGIPAAGVTAPLTTTYAQAGVGTFLTLSQGDTAAGNPRSNFASVGGVNFGDSRSLWINDLSFHGDYMLVDSPAGGISLFGGLTMPMGVMRQNTTVRTVGDKGNGDKATQTETAFAADGSTSFVRVTETTINNSMTADSSMLLAGPVIGLNAFYGLNNGLQLYSQLGYSPILVGTVNTTTTANNRNKSVVTISQAAAGSGQTNGTTTTETNVLIPGRSLTNFNGTETFGSVGLGFRFAGFNLFTEATARSYGLGGFSTTVLGAKLGGAFSF